MDNSSQPKPPYKTIALVLAGILVGIAITVAVQNSNKDSAKVQVAETAPATAQAATPPQNPSPVAPQAAPAPTLPPMPAQAGTWQETPTPGAATSQSNYVPEGRNIEYGNTVSGYTIYTGRRAVDSEEQPSYGSGAAVSTDENGAVVAAPAQPIGRNGLRSNPCVDPSSTFGTSYGRGRPY